MGQTTERAPELTRHVDDLWGSREALPQLIENAEAVERTLQSPGFGIVTTVLEAEIASIDRKLGRRALEHAEYARLHGRRAALLAFADVADAIKGRAVYYTSRANQGSEGESSEGR